MKAALCSTGSGSSVAGAAQLAMASPRRVMVAASGGGGACCRPACLVQRPRASAMAALNAHRVCTSSSSSSSSDGSSRLHAPCMRRQLAATSSSSSSTCSRRSAGGHKPSVAAAARPLQQQQPEAVASAVASRYFVEQQQLAAATSSSRSSISPAPAHQQQHSVPFAALSRVLLTSGNANVFRSALNGRRQPVGGPLGVLLFLATLVAASFAAIRSLLMRRGKSCRSCRGFGLQRCRLCLGSGRVDWAAKLQHFDVCPLCMNRRFLTCGECGGHYHRPMFAHRRRQAGGALEPTAPGARRPGGSGAAQRQGGEGEAQRFAGPIVLNLAGAGGVAVARSAGVAPSQQGLGSRVLSSMSD